MIINKLHKTLFIQGLSSFLTKYLQFKKDVSIKKPCIAILWFKINSAKSLICLYMISNKIHEDLHY